jgi:hypothetical protein
VESGQQPGAAGSERELRLSLALREPAALLSMRRS